MMLSGNGLNILMLSKGKSDNWIIDMKDELTIRRLHYMMALMCILSFVGCTDDSYRGGAVEDMDTTYPIPVLVSVGDPSDNIISKGTGAIDDADDLVDKSREIFVYAFGHGKDVSYRTTSQEDCRQCLVDASQDGGGLLGKAASVRGKDPYAVWSNHENEIYWPSDDMSMESFDFFAYYIDDIVPENIDRNVDYVSFGLEIDGTEDVMLSRAELLESQMKDFNSVEREHIRKYAFSYYTAQRNVVPVFCFGHQLVKIDFEVKPGITAGISKEVTINSVEVESQTKARFTVAHKDKSQLGLDFYGEKKWLSLTENEIGEDNRRLPLDPDNYRFYTLDDASDKAEPIRVGGELLVAPGIQYECRMSITEKGEDGVEHRNDENEVSITVPDGVFNAGSSYKVSVTVYGYMNIHVTVDMNEWKPGGNVNLDDKYE